VTQDPKPGWRRVQLSRKGRILRSTGLHDKTLWDWLQLLVVPIVIALLAGLFTTVQILYQQAAEERLQNRITDQNAQIQRFIEEQRAQSASIGAYLDLMTQLLLERNLTDSDENSVVRAIAQAQTTRVLRDADPRSKQTVLLFLYDSGLISEGGQLAIVALSNADLSEADLRHTDLRNVELSGADLTDAKLSNSDLSKANLNNSNLSNATLSNASLNDANLSNASLSEANLSGANLSGADLSGANLSGTLLFSADLSGANLSGAKGVAEGELEEFNAMLERATMPGGSIHD
jgi:uncharacterized protein YjbI with pentapeptide repeats